MINKLISFSSGSSGSTRRSTSSKSVQRPTNVNNPMMMLAFSKVARGESAGLMPSMAKACVEECGVGAVAPSFTPETTYSFFMFVCRSVYKQLSYATLKYGYIYTVMSLRSIDFNEVGGEGWGG